VVTDWFTEREHDWKARSPTWRSDMSTVYAKAVCEALPHALLVVDRFHLSKRPTRWSMPSGAGSPRRNGVGVAARAMSSGSIGARLLRAAERLTDEQRPKLFEKLTSADPHGDIAAAWIARELLRDVLSCTDRGGLRYEIRAALHRFYMFCAACRVPEIGKLAVTISAWQEPMIIVITTGLSNARSEGYNRIVGHVGRIAFGFRTPENQRRRVRWTCTRQSRRASSSVRQLRPC
jgi:transposase